MSDNFFDLTYNSWGGNGPVTLTDNLLGRFFWGEIGIGRVLAAYYYGNLTHPSQDPPRVGLLSTVPSDAGDLLKVAVEAAEAAGGLFAGTFPPPPPLPYFYLTSSSTDQTSSPQRQKPPMLPRRARTSPQRLESEGFPKLRPRLLQQQL